MHSVFKRRLSLGIGLLELMLSLAIIAILLIMATRYYQSASENNKRNNAVDMFAAVNGAVQTWRVDQIMSPGTTLPTIQQLVNGGYLPPAYGSGTNVAPWGGTITVGGSVSNGTYTIAMDGIPTNSCTPVCKRVASTIAAPSDGGGVAPKAPGADADADASSDRATCGGDDGNTCTATYTF